MTCRELERLFLAGAPDADVAAHRRSCDSCDAVGRAMDETLALTSPLRAPAWSPALRKSLLEIPRQTVSCEGAEPLLALAVENELAGEDKKRLESHLSRCEACMEAAGALFGVRDLEAPPAPPWLAARLAAVRPEKKKSFWRSALSGKAVVAYAYAAAVLVMILGLNPTAVSGKGFAKLGESTRNVVTVAQSSVGDRLGALQEKTLRTFEVWKGHVGGYGRAAFSNAVALVLRPEPKKTPSRPRIGKDGGGAAGPEGFSEAGKPAPEHFASRFRV